MSHFGRNIKKIRTAKKISQTAFADLFNLKRGSVGAYEEGRAEAKIDTVIEIASFYKLSIDQLLCKELTINEIYHIPEINQKYDISNPKGQLYVEIPFVNENDRFEFIKKFNDQIYLQGLQSIRLPNIKPNDIAFEHTGSSMMTNFSGIKNGDILIAEPFQMNISDKFKENTVYIVLENENIHVCRMLDEGESVILKFDNHNYSSISVHKSDIKVIWSVYKLIVCLYPLAQNFETRLINIENKLDEIIKTKGIT